MQILTKEAEDILDGGNKDDQEVGATQQDHGDDDVADPAEVFLGAHEVDDGCTDLYRRRRRG